MNKILSILPPAITSSYWEQIGNQVRDTKGSAAALKAYEKALTLLPAPPHPHQVYYLECNIGLGYAEQQDFVKSLSHYLQAWNRRRAASPEAQQALAGDIADCCFKTQDFPQAIAFYQRKINLLDSQDPHQKKIQQIIRHKIAKAKIHLELFEEAIPLLQEVLSYHKQNLPSPHKSLMVICNQMAFCYDNLKQLEKAVLFTQQALDHCPSDHLEGKRLIFYNLAKRHLGLEKHQEALEFVEASRQVATSLSQNLLLEAQCYMIEGDCYKAQKNLERAFTAYQSASALYKDLKMFPMFDQSLLNMSVCLTHQKKYSEAILTYKELLKSIKTHQPEKPHRLIDILVKMGKIEELCQQDFQAMIYYRKAWKWTKKTNSQNPLALQNILLPLSLCYHRLKDTKRAKILWHIADLTAELDFPQEETIKVELLRTKEAIGFD